MSAISSTGMIFRVIPRTVFTLNMTGGTTPAANAVFPIATHIDVSPFQEVDVQLRVHAITVASGTFTFLVGSEGFTQEDPTNTFTATLSGGSATLTTTGYQLINLSGSTVFGRLLYMQLTINGTAVSTSPSITLSVDLACKGGDPSGIQPAYNTYRGYR